MVYLRPGDGKPGSNNEGRGRSLPRPFYLGLHIFRQACLGGVFVIGYRWRSTIGCFSRAKASVGKTMAALTGVRSVRVDGAKQCRSCLGWCISMATIMM